MGIERVTEPKVLEALDGSKVIEISKEVRPLDLVYPAGPPGVAGPAGEYPLLIQYSVDGSTGWHDTPVMADSYVRFSADDGATWGTAWYIRGEQGNPGDNAPEVSFQYSVDGSTGWHSPFVEGDLYCRVSTDGEATWSSEIKFVGADGADGAIWLSGSGIPASGLGGDGDFYLDTTNWDVYEKEAGSWVLKGNIEGAPGEGSGDVVGPASSVDGNFPVFSGTSGKVIADSGQKPADYSAVGHDHAGVYAPDSHDHSGVYSLISHDHAGVYSPTSHDHSGVYEPVIGAKGTAFNKNFGSVAGDVCQGNDSRLSDARTPTEHGNDKHSATYLVDVIDDTTPQLGGNLDVNGKTFIQTASAKFEFGTDEKQVDFNSNNAHFTLVNNTTGTTIDWRKGNKQTIAPTSAPIYTFTAPGGACSLTLKITQHSTAVTITWPAAVKWCGSTPDFATSSAVYIVSMFYDGTYYWATSAEEVSA